MYRIPTTILTAAILFLMLPASLAHTAATANDANTPSTSQAQPAKQNIDPNAVEFRIVPVMGKELLPDEVDAIKAGNSPLFLNKDCAWADVDPNVTIAPAWVTRMGADGITELLVSNLPSEVLLPDGSWNIKSVKVNDSGKQPELSLEFGGKGPARIQGLTSKNIGRPLAIVVRGRVVWAPRIESPITDKATITGSFTAAQLNALMKSMMKKQAISIEARIMTASPDAMLRLVEKVQPGYSPTEPLALTLTDKEAGLLLDAISGEPNVVVVTAPRIMVFAEETATVSIGDGSEKIELTITPHLARKGSIRIDFKYAWSMISKGDVRVRDMKTTNTGFTVTAGKQTLRALSGMTVQGKSSWTYALIKASPEKP